MIFDRHAQTPEVGQRALDAGLGRVEEQQKTLEAEASLVTRVVGGFGFEWAAGDIEHTKALLAPSGEALFEGGLLRVVEGDFGLDQAQAFAHRQHAGEGALGQQRRRTIRPGDDDGEALAQKVIGDFVELAPGGRIEP